jgi:hypothetical protein
VGSAKYVGTVRNSHEKMKDWHWDSRVTCGEPQGTASWPSVEGGQTTRCGPRGGSEGIIGELFYLPLFLSVSRDSQSDRRNSPLGKEKAPCSERFGSLMGSQYDQRGGGPDERTNNGPKDSCHRSHVGALARGSVDHCYLSGGGSLMGAGSASEDGKGAAGVPAGSSWSGATKFPLPVSGD